MIRKTLRSDAFLAAEKEITILPSLNLVTIYFGFSFGYGVYTLNLWPQTYCD